MDEARLEDVGSGLAPTSPGWFVVNVADAAWIVNDSFGARCIFESNPRVLQNRPDLEPQHFEQLGVTLAVLPAGRSGGLYHSESAQEDFLVLAGKCLLLVEGEERPLRQWDFFHSPPGVEHIFVGQGDTPCVLLMVGTRPEGKTLHYPRDETALRHDAGVEESTPSPHEAYAPYPHWRPGRPETWNDLPWVRSPG
jgi:uncharacterized cupin superfamily protein